MGQQRPDNIDVTGDESVLSPRHLVSSLLASERGTNKTRRLETDASGNLYVAATVNVAADGAIVDGANSAIRGTVLDTPTASPVGTDNPQLVSLNGTTVPLPTGAATLTEQQTQTASLSVLDDWDEGDRAKVNPISGQVGVQGGSGVVSASTQRVVLATDIPLPAGGNQIGSTIPDRPSQKTGRVYKEGFLDHQTTGQTAYTVTNGKTLYVTSIAISAFNASAVANGRLRVRDNTTVKIPVSIPTAGVAALASLVPATLTALSFPEPIPFGTNLNVDLPAGTVTYSLSFSGYEE